MVLLTSATYKWLGIYCLAGWPADLNPKCVGIFNQSINQYSVGRKQECSLMWLLLIMTFNSHLRTSSVLLQAFIKVHDAMLADYLYTQTFLSQRLGAESLSLSVITYHMFRCGGVNLCSAVHFLKKWNQISYFWIKLKLSESCSCFFLPPLSSQCWVKVKWKTNGRYRLYSSFLFPVGTVDLKPIFMRIQMSFHTSIGLI